MTVCLERFVKYSWLVPIHSEILLQYMWSSSGQLKGCQVLPKISQVSKPVTCAKALLNGTAVHHGTGQHPVLGGHCHVGRNHGLQRDPGRASLTLWLPSESGHILPVEHSPRMNRRPLFKPGPVTNRITSGKSQEQHESVSLSIKWGQQ